jgi:hypothetical protein
MTDLSAINRALTLIGVEPIGSLSDNGKAARTMSALIADTKRVVLNEFPWSFAQRIDALVESGTPPTGYLKFFQYPDDALVIHRVYNNVDFRGVAEFRVLSNGSGTRGIAANIDAGSVEYTIDIQDLELWPTQIAECLVTRLASDAATALTGDARMGISLLEKYAALARVATQTSVVEENIPTMRATDYISTRTK